MNQLQEHLAATQAQMDDWIFWYDQEYGSECEMVQEDQDEEEEAAEANQVGPEVPIPAPDPSLPITPPVVLGHVPPELLRPRRIPSFLAPSPPPAQDQQLQQPQQRKQLEASRNESTQTAPPGQIEPSAPSQQSLPSTHRCPQSAPPALMTQEYVTPATPVACLLGGAKPSSSPQHPGAGVGCVPRSPPPPALISGDGSAWAFTRQVYRNPAQQAQAVEGQALPTSAGVTEPSLYQRSSVPYQQWAAGWAAGASTAQSNAGALPAMAVNSQLSPHWSSLSARTCHHCQSLI